MGARMAHEIAGAPGIIRHVSPAPLSPTYTTYSSYIYKAGPSNILFWMAPV